MAGLLRKIIGDPNERALKKFRFVVEKINALEQGIEPLTDDELRSKTGEFRARLEKGETLDEILPEAFALIREASKRALGQRHYDVQLVGGIVLHRGQIAEMKTGEGKTLVATLPVYLNALTGRGVHVVTVNDYLAKRDPVWMGPIYSLLGLTVSCLQHESAYAYDPSEEDGDSGLKYLRKVSRRDAYESDVTYGTNNEFGFDYLRDNMAVESNRLVQRELNYAIVDEVDNILIDEARTPLIISGPAQEPVQLYHSFARLVPRLKDEEDYAIEEKGHIVSLTQSGISKMERWVKVGNLYAPENYHLVQYIENALTAQVLRRRDRDYVVRNGEVVIVDEFTGRLQVGRRWSDGLHQAVEAKENLKVQRESITYATITLQNYFRMYQKLAGMTGTAATEAEEFYKIYNLEVVTVPTNKPLVRTELPERVYLTEEAKWEAVAEEILELHDQGRPVLVGTTSIEQSEGLSKLLDKRGLAIQLLNAKHHEREASIVAQAGRPGAVTVATHMAGRGTDIILGGNPEAVGVSQAEWQQDHDRVVGFGGMHIIGTEHHDARRIDNPLRGRSGRQGDPGTSRFYTALDDDLMKRFGGDRIKGLIGWIGLDQDAPIENRFVEKSIGSAQLKVEGYHFDIRKHLLEFDNVLNNQREVIYKERRKILEDTDLKTNMLRGMIHQELQGIVRRFLPENDSDNWDMNGLLAEVNALFPHLPQELGREEFMVGYSRGEIERRLSDYADEAYAQKECDVGESNMRTLERLLMLRTVDTHWVQHLTALEGLRQGVGLQAVGQRDPLVVYKTEGHKMFQDLLRSIQRDIIHTVYQVSLKPANGVRRTAKTPSSPMEAVTAMGGETVHAGGRKVGRNEPCFCGSGKKYKRCHGASV